MPASRGGGGWHLRGPHVGPHREGPGIAAADPGPSGAAGGGSPPGEGGAGRRWCSTGQVVDRTVAAIHRPSEAVRHARFGGTEVRPVPSLAAVAAPGHSGHGKKEEEAQEAGVDRVLTEVEAGWFRGASARANYLAQDRFDLAFAAKELCRRMAVPRQSDLVALRRLARYVLEVPRLVQCFRWQEPTRGFVVYTDTDFAGCPRTRRSTNGGAIMRGATWSSTIARPRRW